jgi:hypothetical protein
MIADFFLVKTLQQIMKIDFWIFDICRKNFLEFVSDLVQEKMD